MEQVHRVTLAYIIGVALGDGNLSSPNKRAIRLRITCDTQYPFVAQEITNALSILFPTNKVRVVPGPKDTYFNISVYSNKLAAYMPWRVGEGTKIDQRARVPHWVYEDIRYVRACLRGLLQTDGSIYSDRGYLMTNFTNNIYELVKDVKTMIELLGYQPHLYAATQRSGNPKYTVRLSRGVKSFIQEIELVKK